MEYGLAFVAFVAAVVAARGQTWDESRPRRLKFTGWGWGALVAACLALILSIVVTAKKDRDQKKLDENQKEQIANQKLQLGISEGIKENQAGFTKKQEEHLRISEDLVKKQEEQLEISQRLTKELNEQLSLLSRLSDSQRTQIELSTNLTTQQRQQLRQLAQMRLDRDLIGVEISFEPSAKHWADIASICDKIKPLSSGFPYSAATITAERVGGYWDIDFSEIRNERGTIQPPPVTTNLPENKAFENVIDTALLELRIEWIGGNNSNGGSVSTLSGVRGDYPTSIIISKKRIAFILRPPKLRLNLNDLHSNPTVKLRSQLQYPVHITFRSLDNRVLFDEQIKPNWEEKGGESHAERWMPYISGPHHLTIDWSRLLN